MPNQQSQTNQPTPSDNVARMPRPHWLRVKLTSTPEAARTRAIVRAQNLTTVCEEAACPNLSECWSKKHATMMIMGDVCTRACAFCNVATGRPRPLDPEEPGRVAQAVRQLELRHVVITSVDRDDLPDGGAGHFASVIGEIRNAYETTGPAAVAAPTIEILTPDFLRKADALETVMHAAPDVFNHNLETVPGLYPTIRPGARYYHSLRLLERAKVLAPNAFTKSGIMVGLGETREAVVQVMDDMRIAGVDFLTIGQYLQPTKNHAPVDRYVPPAEFESLKATALSKGFELVAASPFTRSSYHADEDFRKLQAARQSRAENVTHNYPDTSHRPAG